MGLKEETDASLEKEVDRMHWVSLGEIGQIPDLLKREGAKELILAGQIRAERLLAREEQFDGITRGLMKLMPDRSGNSAMRIAVRYLESQGFRVLDSGTFLKDWIPKRGVLTHRPPDAQEQADLDQGLKLARKLADWDVGQTVVMRKKAVVALEALEGTDAVIRRAGTLVGSGCVVVKAAGSRQDMRFDIPVVGFETIRAMEEAGITCLGVEARRTMLFDREKLLTLANEKRMVLVAL